MPIYQDFFRGENISKYEQDGFDATDNLDVHSEIGTAQCQLALTSESTTPNENCIIATVDNGDVYFFSTESGKIWKRRASDNAYSLVATNPNGAHTGAKFFNGKLYYASGNKLGRYGDTVTMTIASPCVVTYTAHGMADEAPLAFSTTGALPTGLTAGTTYYVNAINANTFNLAATAGGADINTSGSQSGTHTIWDFNFGTLSNSAAYAPMCVIEDVFFIGSGNNVDMVDETNTFAADALDIYEGYTITALNRVGSDLIIGTIQNSLVSHCKVFLWDKQSAFWTVEDDVDEVGVNAFIRSDNLLLAQCGTSGQLYFWNGTQMQKFKKIGGVTTSVNDYASVTHNGKPLYAIGTDIYSINRENTGLPHAIVHEYTTTTGSITSIGSGDGELLVANGNNIDKIGTNRATAIIDTPLAKGKYTKVVVHYDSLPSGSSIGISTNLNNAGSYTAQTALPGAIKKIVYFDGGLLDPVDLQARITLTPNGANTPVINMIEIV